MGRAWWILLALQVTSASAYETLRDNYLHRPKYDTQVVYEKWVKFDSGVRNLISSAIKTALPSILEATSQLNLTAACMNEGLQFVAGARKVQMWAFRMIDSSSKSLDGMLSGTLGSFGSFEECIDTEVRKRNGDEISFRGKYCLVNIHPPPPLEERTAIETGVGNYSKFSEITLEFLKQAHFIEMDSFKMAACVPSGCTSDDLQQLMEHVGSQLSLRAEIFRCQMKEEVQFETSSIVAISMISIQVFLAAVGTLLDRYSITHGITFHRKSLRILQAFSLTKNYKKLMSTNAPDQILACLHGFRFMSILWIMIFHNYLFVLISFTSHANGQKFLDSIPSLLMQIVSNGTFAVDTFFFMSGLLNCYNRVIAEEKNRSSNVLVLVRRRLWRIYPGYIFALLAGFLIPLLGSGPMYHFAENFKSRCEEQWWQCLLFINNMGEDLEKMCFPHTWYLACDMQLFLIALITIYPLLRWPRIGIVLNVAVCLIFVTFSAVWIWIEENPAAVLFGRPMETYAFFVVYTKPFIHGCTYFVGVLLGYLLAKKKEMKLSKRVQFLAWSLATAVSLSMVFGTQLWNTDVKPTIVSAVFFAVFGRVGLTLSLSWIVICCVYGYGGIVNRILTWKAWVPLSRLTFGIYLLSAIVQVASLAAVKITPEFSHMRLIRRFIVDVLITSALSFLLFLFVESPYAAVENVVLPRSREGAAEKPPTSGIPVEDFVNGAFVDKKDLKVEDTFRTSL